MNKLLLIASVALLGGCATSITPHYDMRFGDAVRQARQQMTVNPSAGNSNDPVTGLDGRTAREAALVYQESFRKPPPAVNVINIGGGIGGASGR